MKRIIIIIIFVDQFEECCPLNIKYFKLWPGVIFLLTHLLMHLYFQNDLCLRHEISFWIYEFQFEQEKVTGPRRRKPQWWLFFWLLFPSLYSHLSSVSRNTYPSSMELEFQLSYFKSWKMMLWKCCTPYASKFEKLSSGHRGKHHFSFQSQRKAMPKMLKLPHNCTHLTR